MMVDQMLASGYEDFFDPDFNGDGLIAVVTAYLYWSSVDVSDLIVV